MRRCKFYETCGFEAEESSFPTYVHHRNGKTYFRNMCEPCFKKWNAEKSRANYIKNRRKVLDKQKERLTTDDDFATKRRAYLKKYKEDNRERVLLSQKESHRKPLGRFKKSIRAAKARGIEWTLTFEDFISISSQPCYYCSNEFCRPVEIGCGLDRIDNCKGYVLGNVVPCGKDCNTLRMNILTPEETKTAITAILAFRSS